MALLRLLTGFCGGVSADWEKQAIEGWAVKDRVELKQEKPAEVEHALAVIRAHLVDLVKVVPAPPVEKLRRATLPLAPRRDIPARSRPEMLQPSIGCGAPVEPLGPWRPGLVGKPRRGFRARRSGK